MKPGDLVRFRGESENGIFVDPVTRKFLKIAPNSIGIFLGNNIPPNDLPYRVARVLFPENGSFNIHSDFLEVLQ